MSGLNYSWKKYRIQVDGIDFAEVESSQFTDEQALEFVYGTGDLPQDLVEGNISFTGSLTIRLGELQKLFTKYATATISGLPFLTMVEKFENGLGQIVTKTYMSLKFDKADSSINQGDPSTKVSLTWKCLNIK